MNDDEPSTGAVPRRDLAKEKFWRKWIKAFVASGQSVRDFCILHGLSEASFYAWRRTLAQRDAKSAPAAAPTPPLVPVHVLGSGGGRIEIILSGRRRICLRPPVDTASLAQVLAVLEHSSGREA
jgi:transposase-like protein